MHLQRRILVTGGAGFVGSYLCEALLARGHELLCVDNFYTSSRRNIEHLIDHQRFELMRHDVTFPLYVEVDEIYNMACPASPVHYQRDPVQTTKTSVHGAINMLGLAKRVKAKILIRGLAEKILAISGSRSKLEFRPLPTDDPKQRQPNISRAQSVLGWTPKIELDEGLKKTIPYFEGLLSSGLA